MTIQKYEDWMRPQVVALFSREYGTAIDEFDKLFQRFYEHPFQIEHGIRIVAVENEIVAGFQSFFYWPVVINGKTVRAYQSGNSLVSVVFRGKGLFAKMLNYIHLPESGFNCELLIGFPVEASYNSFIRNQWKHPFSLQWYVKPLHPVRSLVSNSESQLHKKWPARFPLTFHADAEETAIEQTLDFDKYRFNFQQGDYYRFTYKKNGQEAFFELKAQRRKSVIRELVLGKFLFTNANDSFMKEAFRHLILAINSSAHFTLLSIAINPLNKKYTLVMDALGFRKIERQIYFIAKGILADSITDWSQWNMQRGDIDTW